MVAAAVPDLVPPTWPGVVVAAAVTAGLGIALLLAARRRRWSIRHAAAVAVGFLLARGLLAFTYFPLSGEVSPVAKYTHNAVMLLVVLLAGAVALRRRSKIPESTRSPGVASSDP